MKTYSILLLLLFVSIVSFSQKNQHKIYRDQELYGIKDQNNKIILKPSNKYDYLDYVDFMYSITGKTELIRSDSLFIMKLNRRYGIINLEGKEIIPAIYSWIQPTHSIIGNYFLLKDTTEKRGIADTIGNYIIPIKYDDVTIVDKFEAKEFPYISVRNKNKYGVFDFKGNEILPVEYRHISLNKVHLSNPKFKDQDYYYFKVRIGNEETFVDLNGNILYPPTKAQYLFLRESEKSSTGLEIFEGTGLLGAFGKGTYTITELYTNKIIESFNGDKRKELIDSGDNYYKQEKYKKAAECYLEALNTKGLFDYLLHYKLGICYYRTKKYDKAISEFTICKETTPYQDMKDCAEECIKASQDTKEVIDSRNESIALGFFSFALSASEAYVRLQNNSKTQRNSKITSMSNGNSSEDYSSERVTGNSNNSKTECSLCNGKGSIVEYTSNFGISDRKYCKECGKTVDSTHYHKTCTRCGGKGYK